MKTDFEGKQLSVKFLLRHIATDSEHLASILGSATDSLHGLRQVLSALSLHLFFLLKQTRVFLSSPFGFCLDHPEMCITLRKTSNNIFSLDNFI